MLNRPVSSVSNKNGRSGMQSGLRSGDKHLKAAGEKLCFFPWGHDDSRPQTIRKLLQKDLCTSRMRAR